MRASRSDTSYSKMLKAVVAKRSPARVLEWGPGHSTRQLAALLPGAEIVSIEHDADWYAHWQSHLDSRVDLRLLPLGERYGQYAAPDVRGLFDLIFVDGRWRRRCLLTAAKRLAPGGVVVVHDAQREWYHPAFEKFEYRGWDDYDTVVLSQNPLDDIATHLALLPGPDTVHIVMITHAARQRFLKRTVPAVLATGDDFTLTVVANGPSKSSRRYLESVRADLFGLIVNPENIGKPKAANAGWRLRDAAYTVLLDDDALALDPAWLGELVAIARQCPDAGIVGHSLETHDWPRRECGGLAVQHQPGNLGGACLMVPRRTRQLCGTYNEELPHYGESDGLYGWKVRKAGLHCYYHDHGDTGRRFEHIDDGRNKQYREWKDQTRSDAQQIAARLRREYDGGRPLNT